jgi:hypothetical protein
VELLAAMTNTIKRSFAYVARYENGIQAADAHPQDRQRHLPRLRRC